jgi:chromosome partition protein MukB
VFYERYLLDRHVTALEGANGAGKTTVMIAAYVVLLPDMSRLRFTNLGETGATGGDKGIWGRLGEPGVRRTPCSSSPCRASAASSRASTSSGRASPPSSRRRSSSPGWKPTCALQDLLLVKQGESEAVPELPELRENAARLGGRSRRSRRRATTSPRSSIRASRRCGSAPTRSATS